MEELERKFKALLLNKVVTGIELYNVNGQAREFAKGAQWLIDGGFQIKFKDSQFSFGWDYDQEGYDYSFEKDITQMLGETPHFEIGTKNIRGISSLTGKCIIDLNIRWQYYLDYNEDGEVSDKRTYVPVELVFMLNSSERLQVALIDFTTKLDPFIIENLVYDLGGELLISLNEIVEIDDSVNS